MLLFGYWNLMLGILLKGGEEGRGTDVKFYPIAKYPIVNSTSVRKML